MAGCEAQKTPVPTGGSRSDALVEMSFDVSALEIPVVDWETAAKSATKRCNAWGYRHADPFEGTKTQCQSTDIYGGCNYATVTRVYQCIN
ncbi:YecR family lipoprotein [Pseudoruegeria sp. HB172150]|uniref:YecR family lipoprotein n=1 Tax=Pseudoruegeria sp. HB172150 TaxID=2721164 RepID=UPI00352D9EC8